MPPQCEYSSVGGAEMLAMWDRPLQQPTLVSLSHESQRDRPGYRVFARPAQRDPLPRVIGSARAQRRSRRVNLPRAVQGFDVRESYPLQDRVAHAEGCDDPIMDAYNDYDAHRSS